MMRAVVAISLIALALLSAELWAPLLLEHPAVRAFTLSDRFWPSALGMALGIGAICAAATAAFVFHPGALPGRRPEGGE